MAVATSKVVNERDGTARIDIPAESDARVRADKTINPRLASKKLSCTVRLVDADQPVLTDPNALTLLTMPAQPSSHSDFRFAEG